MKQRNRACLLSLLMALALLSGCSGDLSSSLAPIDKPVPEAGNAFQAYAAVPDAPDGMAGVCQRGNLCLYVNPETASVAVFDRASGQWFYSNPPDVKRDSRAGKTEKNVLQSQLSVSYYQEDLTLGTFYSFQDAVDKGQFTLEALEDGLRVTYQMGVTRAATELMPRYITPERMQEKVYSHLAEEEIAYIQKRYIASTTKEGYLELPPATRKSTIVAKKLAGYFEKAGYTWEDQAEDNLLCGYEPEDTSRYIAIALEYRLAEDHLSASVLMDEACCVGNISIAGVSVLPYFGAGSTEDEGYMLVPGGSGALIRFNNGKQKEAVYYQQIYGTDPADSSLGRLQTSQEVRLPVFGVKRNDSAFLAVVTQGEAEGYINADVSQRKNSYNYAYASFSLRDADDLSLSSSTGTETSMRILEKNVYAGPLEVQYYFLDAGAGYSEMAAKYRELLAGQGVLKPLEALGQAPVYLSVIGAIEKTERILGVPYDALVTMTDDSQAAAMLERLTALCDVSVRMRYMGWFNGGVDHESASAVSINSLTSRAGLFDLSRRLKDSGGALYLDVAFQYVPEDSGNFSTAQEAVRTISGEVKKEALYLLGGAPSTQQKLGKLFYITTPAALPRRISAFVQELDDLAELNFSLRDLASALPSDPYTQRSTSRTQAQKTIERELSSFQEAVGSVMAAAPNAYALAAADEIINAPTEGVAFYIVDESVPFYAMVLHGMKDYAGVPMNTKADFDPQNDLLIMLEHGSIPHFMLSWEESYRMSGSVYEQWYSVSSDAWLETCAAFAEVYEEVLLPLRQYAMVQHEVLENGLRIVTYSDGTRICINRQDETAEYEGHQIPGMNYLVLKGAGSP